MKIHIFGASGAGVSTLGKSLSEKLNIPYFDSDSYFWENTATPFTVKRDLELRNQLVNLDLTSTESWIFGGSSLKWGNQVFTSFDLLVFLWLSPEIRLKKRELERYGEVIFKDPDRIKLYQEFIGWAKNYDIDLQFLDFQIAP